MIHPLTDYERKRYNRQMLFPGWGEESQKKIKSSTVFIAGAGGIGGPVALYLTAAGVGKIRICDADDVDLSNLNRQILYTDAEIGMPKAQVAGRALRELNPAIEIEEVGERLQEETIASLVGKPDILIDCVDSFITRSLLNGYCVQRGIPLVHGAVSGFQGQVTFIHPPDTPCYRCIFSDPPLQTIPPVIGPTPGVVGALQAMEVLKYLAGIGKNLKGQLLFFDGIRMNFSTIRIERNSSCPACNHLK